MGIWNSTPEDRNSKRFQFDGRTGLHELVDRYPIDGIWQESKIEFHVGQRCVFDFGRFFVGPVTYTPKFDASKLKPFGTPGIEDAILPYKDSFRIPVYSRHFGGLRSYMKSSISVQYVLERMWCQFASAPEAQAGKIPVFENGDSERRFNDAVSGGGDYFVPVYFIVDWSPRPEDIFGPRVVPIPKPLVMPTALPSAAPHRPAISTQQAQAPLPRSTPAAPAPKPSVPAELNDEIPW